MWYWVIGVFLSLLLSIGAFLLTLKKKEDIGWARVYGVFSFVMLIMVLFVINALFRAT